MDICPEPDCGEEFPADVTHGRCPRCGAKLHIVRESRVLDDQGFMRNILGSD